MMFQVCQPSFTTGLLGYDHHRLLFLVFLFWIWFARPFGFCVLEILEAFSPKLQLSVYVGVSPDYIKQMLFRWLDLAFIIKTFRAESASMKTSVFAIVFWHHFSFRYAFPFQNGWIFGKVPNGFWPPPPPSFSESYVTNFFRNSWPKYRL